MTGTSPAVQPPAGGPRRRLLPWALRGLAVLGLAVLLFSPARLGLDPTLDHSNYGTYAWFAAHEAQYGRDVLPMAGPYGFVPYGFLYAGHLFGERLVLELLTKAGLAALLLWFFARAGGGVVRWVWLAAVLLMTPLAEDLTYDLAILFAGLFLLERFSRREAAPGWRGLLPDLGVAAFLGLLTLFKGTHAVLSLATFALLAALGIWRRDFRRLGTLAATYIAAIVVLLLAAGQNPLHLPAYLRGILELSSGYNDAMVLNEPLLAFLTGAGALLALEAGVLLGLVARRREPAAWPALLLFALFTFVEWKHGFVRADGHVYIFYQFACLAAPTLWLLLRVGREEPALPRPLLVGGAALVSIAAALGLLGDRPAALPRHLWVFEELPGRLGASAKQLLAPGRAKRELNEDLKHHRRIYDLPQVREVVGDRAIDFFGTEHGYLLLNQLNYRPRPMGGGAFNVFTPWLQDRNRRHVTSPDTRPAHFLVRLETIDERFVAQDDPGTLRALLDGYAPVQAEQGMLLLAARPDAPAPAEPRLLGTRAARLGEELVVPEVEPGEILALEIRAPLTLAGRLRRLLYKPPLLLADLAGDGITRTGARRVVPRLFSRPIPASPVLENTHDLLALYRGDPGKRLRGIRLYSPDPGWFDQDALSVSFFALPRPAPIPEATAEALRQKLDFPVANRLPLEVAAAVVRIGRHAALAVHALEPPGVMRFPVGPGDNSVRFVYGLLPEAYERHATDGVDFMVELTQAGQPPRELFRRLLRPRTNAADRGLQVETVPLPPDLRDGTLALLTGIGPDRDGAWDWAFYSGIHIGSGGYIPLQFPGFGLLPDRVESTTAGVGVHEGRRVLMAHAPSRLLFTLGGRERLLEFGGGLLPGAYTGGGGSDGVEFVVTLVTAGGGREVVFRRHLNPRDEPADRGSPAFAIALPPHAAGTGLELAIMGGPAGDISWDWSYVEGVRVK